MCQDLHTDPNSHSPGVGTSVTYPYSNRGEWFEKSPWGEAYFDQRAGHEGGHVLRIIDTTDPGNIMTLLDFGNKPTEEDIAMALSAHGFDLLGTTPFPSYGGTPTAIPTSWTYYGGNYGWVPRAVANSHYGTTGNRIGGPGYTVPYSYTPFSGSWQGINPGWASFPGPQAGEGSSGKTVPYDKM
jgi:hypothetical protein